MSEDEDDCEVDVCQGCGGYYTWQTHRGLLAWDRARDGVAPQLCVRCWRDQGYTWPESIKP